MPTSIGKLFAPNPLASTSMMAGKALLKMPMLLITIYVFSVATIR